MPDMSGSAATIRQTYQGVRNQYVNIVPLEVYATADVNGTPTFPTAELTVDNATAGWQQMEPQSLVRITRSGALIWEGTVRKVTGSDTVIHIANINEGDSGSALRIAPDIQDNDLVTVYTVLVPFAYFSRIDPDTGEFYKRYDIGWDTLSDPFDKLTLEPAPVVNMGAHRHIRIAPAGTAAWQMTGADSYSWFGNAVEYLWTLPTGVSFTSPSVDTDETVDLEAGADWYIIQLRGEDATTGKRDNSYRYVFVTDGDDFKAFSEDFGCKVIGDTVNRAGRAVTLEVKANRGTDVMSRLYKSAPVLITYDHVYSDDQWTTVDAAPSGMVENFFGYIRSYELIGTSPDGIDTYHVLIESPLLYHAALPIAAQTIIAKPAVDVDDWDKVVDTLAHVAYFVYYLLQYHGSALLSLSDFFIGDLDEFFRAALSVPATNMLNAAQKAVGLCTGANIGCVSDGSIYLRRHGSYENTPWRNALTNVWTWQASDIVGDLSYTYNPLMEVSETEGAGTVTSTDVPPVKVRARAGLFAGMQGLGVDPMEAFIGDDSNDIRDRVGHQHQRTNSPVKAVTFAARGGHGFIEPALMEWHTLDLNTYDPGNTGILDNSRVLSTQVTRNWQYTRTGILLSQSVGFEPETMGKRAPLVPASLIGAPFSPDASLAACTTLNITWSSTGATPSGWSGLTGTDQTNPQTYFGATYTAWDGTRAGSNTNWISACIPEAFGVMYEFASPCTLNSLSVTFAWTGTPTTKRISFLGLVNGVWTTIDTILYGSGVSNTGATHSWSGSLAVTKVIFGCATSATSSVITMTVSKINSP